MTEDRQVKEEETREDHTRTYQLLPKLLYRPLDFSVEARGERHVVVAQLHRLLSDNIPCRPQRADGKGEQWKKPTGECFAAGCVFLYKASMEAWWCGKSVGVPDFHSASCIFRQLHQRFRVRFLDKGAACWRGFEHVRL